MGTDEINEFAAMLLPAIVAAIGILLIAALALRRLLRPRAFRKLAAELGFEWRGDSSDGTGRDAALLHRGLGTGLIYRNHIGGRADGFQVSIFDQTMSEMLCGASMTSHTVVEISGGGAAAPEFILQPESWLSSHAHWVEDTQGIKFGRDVPFSVHNYIRGADKAAIRAHMNDRVRDLLRENTDLWIQSTGSSYRFYYCGTTLSIAQTKALLTRALAIAKAFAPLG